MLVGSGKCYNYGFDYCFSVNISWKPIGKLPFLMENIYTWSAVFVHCISWNKWKSSKLGLVYEQWNHIIINFLILCFFPHWLFISTSSLILKGLRLLSQLRLRLGGHCKYTFKSACDSNKIQTVHYTVQRWNISGCCHRSMYVKQTVLVCEQLFQPQNLSLQLHWNLWHLVLRLFKVLLFCTPPIDPMHKWQQFKYSFV